MHFFHQKRDTCKVDLDNVCRGQTCFAEIKSSWNVIVRTNAKTLVTIITKRNVMKKTKRNAATINELNRDEDEALNEIQRHFT